MEVDDACKVVVSSMHGGKARKQVGTWEISLKLSAFKAYRHFIVCFLSNYFNDCSVFEMWRQMPLSMWSLLCRGRFHILNPDTFLAVDCCSSCIAMKKSIG